MKAPAENALLIIIVILNLIVIPIALAIGHWAPLPQLSTINLQSSTNRAPIIGRLSDRGFISFENNGELLISPVAHEDSMKKMGITTDRVVNVGGLAELQRAFFESHRAKVFLKPKATHSRSKGNRMKPPPNFQPSTLPF